MQLLRDHGTSWGDDEVRFHIDNMLAHKDCVVNHPENIIPGFLVLDPLTLHTWDSVGKGITEAWCRTHKQVSEQGFHIVSALLIENHWTPIWIVPHGRTLVAHLLHDETADAFDLLSASV